MASAGEVVEEAFPAEDKDFDYATVFDDEDFLDLFLATPGGAAAAAAARLLPSTFSGHGCDATSLGPSVAQPCAEEPNAGGGAAVNEAASEPYVPPTDPASTALARPAGYMNIVMLVDPVADQVTLPQQQVLTGDENKVVSIGPTVLSNFSKLDLSSTVGLLHLAGGALGARSTAPSQDDDEGQASKFLPITPFSMQTEPLCSPQLLTAPSVPPITGLAQHPRSVLAPPFASCPLLLPSLPGSISQQPADAPQPLQTYPLQLGNSGLSPSSVGAADSFDGGNMSVTPSDSHNLVMQSQASMTSASSNLSTAAPAPPLRALSAYNFFFRDERDRILHGGEHEWTREKQQQLLRNHWEQDRTKRRRHRKSHGKIDFSTLSKVISTRWKELPDDRKDFYRQVAAQDWARFQNDLAEYKHGASIDAAAAAAAAASSSGNCEGASASFAAFAFSSVIG